MMRTLLAAALAAAMSTSALAAAAGDGAALAGQWVFSETGHEGGCLMYLNTDAAPVAGAMTLGFDSSPADCDVHQAGRFILTNLKMWSVSGEAITLADEKNVPALVLNKAEPKDGNPLYTDEAKTYQLERVADFE